MTNEDLTGQSIDLLKRSLISRYVYLMLFVLMAYVLIFYFLLNTTLLAGFTLICFGIILYTWLLIRKNYKIELVVHAYLISAPLFAAFIILCFWKYSISSAIWLLPIPLGAYIFFQRKYVYLYALYTVAIILSVMLLSNIFSFTAFEFEDRLLLRISDLLVFVMNIAVFSLLLFYKDKIKKLEIEKGVKSRIIAFENNDAVPVISISKNDYAENVEKYTELFDKIKSVIEDSSMFKQSDFTVSKLCSMLKTNSIYVSRALKLNGYSTFNHYLNTCRINHVKVLIQESDFSKITLMYAYTASGFSNQSTFNRVFKQIEGITPSEYMKTMASAKCPEL